MLQASGPGIEPVQRRPGSQPSVWRLLVRHFFDRFFDRESISPQGDPQAGVTQTLGILAVPGAFLSILFMPLDFWEWDLVAVRYLFLLYSMIVMALIAVLRWDALFPDLRDYQILTPLPVRLSTLFVAKAAALGIFLALFLADINFFITLFWPGLDNGQNLMGRRDSFGVLWTHLVSVAAAGLFSALSMAAVQGVLVTLFRGRTYRRISVALQTLLVAALVMLLFVSPLLAFGTGSLVRRHSPFLYWFPGFWFIGLYERLNPATRNPLLLHLGTYALPAIGIAAAAFLVTYIPGYRRHTRRVVETVEPASAARGRARRWIVLESPVQNAVFHFITQSITRSVKHRLFLATYGGFGAAVAILSLGSGRHGLLTLPLTLSFVLVSGLRAAFNFPSELRANWAFQMTELHPAEEYVAATRKWIVLCAIVPLFLLLAPLEFAFFPPLTAGFHSAFGAGLSVLLMEAMFTGFRKVPFTCAHFPGKVNLTFLGVLYLFGFTLYSRWMSALEERLSQSPAAAIAWLLAVAAVLFWRARTSPRAAALDFEDAGDPVVRTLDLRVG